MKNKLTRLSIVMFASIIALGAVLIFVNPFTVGSHTQGSSLLGGTTPNVLNSGSQATTNQNSTSALSQSPVGTSLGLSQTPPSTSQTSHHHDDGGGDDGSFDN